MRRLRPWLLLLVVGGVVLLPSGWLVTDHLEHDDRFCVSCHLPSGVPLHREKLRDFGLRPPDSLASLHAKAGNRAHADGRFRCIDCHGGTGLGGRVRVKLLSARDAFWYVSGRFEEPKRMTWPLRDADCLHCHKTFRERGASSTNPPFHSLPVHNGALPVHCVECHLSHEKGGLADRFFLHPRVVRAQCARCHSEFSNPGS